MRKGEPPRQKPQGPGGEKSAESRLLEVRKLSVHFCLDAGVVKAVDDVSFHIDRGETLAVVGESGSGKSVTSLAIMGLLPKPQARIAGGSILYEGQDLTRFSERQMRAMRGSQLGIIFQDPMSSLNPVLSIGEQIAERGMVHGGLSRKAGLDEAAELLALVRVPDPRSRVNQYPHQMSGGMRQRVMIAIALACKPKLLIADEPTTALDVTIQAQILELIRSLQRQMGMAILFITHDLGVVAEMADRVVVMYAGRSVEEAAVGPIFAKPKMPYTQALLRSIPRVDHVAGKSERLASIMGTMPSPLNLPQGCAFHPRCEYEQRQCTETAPQLELVKEAHSVRCLRWREIEQQGVTPGGRA